MISDRHALARPARPAPRRQSGTLAKRLPRHPGALARPMTQQLVRHRQDVTHYMDRLVWVRLLLAITFVALAALLYMIQAGQTSVYEYNIASLQSRYAQLSAQNAGLRAAAVSLSSTARIDRDAAQQLHMTKPDIASALWVQVTPPQPLSAPAAETATAAQGQSQPAWWIGQAVSAVRAAL